MNSSTDERTPVRTLDAKAPTIDQLRSMSPGATIEVRVYGQYADLPYRNLVAYLKGRKEGHFTCRWQEPRVKRYADSDGLGRGRQVEIDSIVGRVLLITRTA
jgi:hypothetical protein